MALEPRPHCFVPGLHLLMLRMIDAAVHGRVPQKPDKSE